MDGIIAAPQPIAVEAGAKVLRQGGNAVDAAVAAAFVQGVTDPASCGFGGWGVIHMHPAGQRTSEVIEFYSVLPKSMPPDVFGDDVVGEPGSHGIITGVLQTILNVADHGMMAVEALSASRFRCEHGALQVETRIPSLVQEELTRRGHAVENTLTAYGYTTGAVQFVMIDPQTGAISGAADPRRGGMVLKASTLTARQQSATSFQQKQFPLVS